MVIRISKILIIFIITFGISLVVLPQNVVKADASSSTSDIDDSGSSSGGFVMQQVEKMTGDASGIDTSTFQTTIGRVLGMIQVVAGLFTIVTIALTGFNYILAENVDMKHELQKKMLPIIVGLVCVFGAVSIAQFILGAIEG